MNPPPLLVVMGPTASGKSRLGMEVAQALGGEIISADAFAVYRGLDIGTDKPSAEDRRRVPHHLIDILKPVERYSAGAFAEQADRCIRGIQERDSVPVVVGGTHFYIQALIRGLFPLETTDAETRRRLAGEWNSDPGAVFQRLQRADPRAADAIGPRDRQRILRALEVFTVTGRPITEHWDGHHRRARYRALMVVPERSREDLYVRIDQRVDMMFRRGLEREVRSLLDAGTPYDAHAFKAIGYRELVAMMSGQSDPDETVARIKQSSRQFAKRQLSWLRGPSADPFQWVPPVEEGGASMVFELWRDHIGRSSST